ncbi:MAG: HD domain-containing protein [Thermodesulfobacteriota bacterium]
MTVPELAPSREFFARYVDGFLTRDPAHDENIEIKREHSLRVAGHAAMVADSLDLPPDLDRACRLAGLLHDLGRFEQYRDWRTFDDRSSVDHGRLGCAVLGRTPALAGEAPRVRRLVRAAVLLHNRLHLPAAAPAAALLVTRVVRDADKLDIFRVMTAHFAPDRALNPVVTLGLRDEPGAWSESIAAAIRSRRLAEYAQMRFVNDFKLLILSWVYDLNFPAARRALLESGLAQGLAAQLPPAPEMAALAGQALADLGREHARLASEAE